MIAAYAALLAVGLAAGPVDLDQVKRSGAAAADAWLALVDAGDYAEAWKQAAHLFKSGVTSEDWTKKVKGAREPLGAVAARKQQSARYSETMAGAPDGQYVVVTYITEFQKKKDAAETVIVAHEPDGTWKVAGYWVR